MATRKDSGFISPAGYDASLPLPDEGLYVYRIEEMKPKALPRHEYGVFHNMDAYIVTNVQVDMLPDGSERIKWTIHFWLGQDAHHDKLFCAAFLATRIAKSFSAMTGAHGTTHREEQGDESDAFIAQFLHCRHRDGSQGLRYEEEGGTETALRPLDFYQQPRLFQVQVKPTMLIEVPINRTMLRPDGVCILNTGEGVIFLWHGRNAPHRARGAALELSFKLRQEEKAWEQTGGSGVFRVDVTPIADGEEPDDFIEFFEEAEEDEAQRQAHNARHGDSDGDGERLQPPRPEPLPPAQWRLLRVEQSEVVPVSTGTPTWEALETDTGVNTGMTMSQTKAHVQPHILDCGSELFVWLPRNVDAELKIMCMRVGEELLRTGSAHPRDMWVSPTVVYQGREPVAFRTKFSSWGAREKVPAPAHAFCCLDSKGIISSWSTDAVRTTGVPALEAWGKSFVSTLVAPRSFNVAADAVHNALAGGTAGSSGRGVVTKAQRLLLVVRTQIETESDGNGLRARATQTQVVNLSFYPRRNGRGRVVGVIATREKRRFSQVAAEAAESMALTRQAKGLNGLDDLEAGSSAASSPRQTPQNSPEGGKRVLSALPPAPGITVTGPATATSAAVAAATAAAAAVAAATVATGAATAAAKASSGGGVVTLNDARARRVAARRRKRRTTHRRSIDAAVMEHAGIEADDGSGELQVWTVDIKHPDGLCAVSELNVGHFHSDSCYVILYRFQLPEGTHSGRHGDSGSGSDTDPDNGSPRRSAIAHSLLATAGPMFVIYFWQGRGAKPQDWLQWKLVLSKRYLDEWRGIARAALPQFRIQQHEEPVHFLRVFTCRAKKRQLVFHEPSLSMPMKSLAEEERSERDEAAAAAVAGLAAAVAQADAIDGDGAASNGSNSNTTTSSSSDSESDDHGVDNSDDYDDDGDDNDSNDSSPNGRTRMPRRITLHRSASEVIPHHAKLERERSTVSEGAIDADGSGDGQPRTRVARRNAVLPTGAAAMAKLRFTNVLRRELGRIKDSELRALGALQKPPPAVKRLAKALCMLMQLSPRTVPRSSDGAYQRNESGYTHWVVPKSVCDYFSPIAALLQEPNRAREQLAAVAHDNFSPQLLWRWHRFLLRTYASTDIDTDSDVDVEAGPDAHSKSRPYSVEQSSVGKVHDARRLYPAATKLQRWLGVALRAVSEERRRCQQLTKDGVSLYHVRAIVGEDFPHAVQTEVSPASVSSNGVFVAVRQAVRPAGQAAWLWVGQQSSQSERAAGALAVLRLMRWHGLAPGVEVTVVREADAPWHWAMRSFWCTLGVAVGQYDRHMYSVGTSRLACMFICSYNTVGEFHVREQPRFTQRDLKDDAVVILDTVQRLFVWHGERSSLSKREQAHDAAKRYHEAHGVAEEIIVVREGAEPGAFKAAFHAWKGVVKAFSDPYAERLEQRRKTGLLGDQAALIGRVVEDHERQKLLGK